MMMWKAAPAKAALAIGAAGALGVLAFFGTGLLSNIVDDNHPTNNAASTSFFSAGRRATSVYDFRDPKTTAPQDSANTSKCLQLRGQDGSWIRSKGYKYQGRGSAIRISEAKRFGAAERTKWKYVDNERQCQMHPLTREGFCNVMEFFGMERIFFVGDSITFQQLNSFWWLLGEDGDFGSKLGYDYTTRRIQCGPFYSFEIAWARNDNLRDFGLDDHHHDWITHYEANPGKTMLIANTGAHTPPDQYAYDMDQFVESVQRLNRPIDMTIYRTSVPGHANCKKYKKPLSGFLEYQDLKFGTEGTYKNWNHMNEFNQYTKNKLSDLTASTIAGSKENNWFILDIYPMTILRPDGHRRPNGDCLHYLYPGPQDSWNHLLYSNLLTLMELAIDEMLQQQMEQGGGYFNPIAQLQTPLGSELARREKRLGVH